MTDTPTPEALADPLLAELREKLAELTAMFPGEWRPGLNGDRYAIETDGLMPVTGGQSGAVAAISAIVNAAPALLDAAARVAALEQRAGALGVAGQAMYNAVRPYWESVQRPESVIEYGTLVTTDVPAEHTAESALIAAMKAWDRALSSQDAS